MHPRRTIVLVALGLLAAALDIPAAGAVTGTLDPAFGTGGVARVDLSAPSIDVAHGMSDSGLMVGTSNDRFALAGTANPSGSSPARGTLVVDFDSPSAAYAAATANDTVVVGRAGDDFALVRLTSSNVLVPGFGDQGRVRTSFGRPAVARGVALGVEDTVVAGTVGSGSGTDLALARYDAQGRLVPGFGTGGTVVVDLSGSADAAYALRNESRNTPGNFILAGREGGAALVGRIRPDGSWDPTFGVGGRTVIDVTPGDDVAYGLAIQVAGTAIVVAGTAGAGAFVARLTPDGVLDPSFGTGGVALVDLGPGGGFSSVVTGRTPNIQGAKDTVVAGGTSVGPAGSDGVIVRLSENGTLDASFGAGGKAVIDFGGAADRGTGVGATTETSGDGATARLSGDDGLDLRVAWVDGDGRPTFLPEGTVSRAIDFSVFSEHAQEMAVLPDGAIVVVGRGDRGLVMARFRPDGRLDPAFGRQGIVTELGSQAESVALQPDGKILVGGSRGSTPGVWRFLPDGRIDAAFGDNLGFMILPALGRETVGAIAVRPDGHIVVGSSTVSVLSPTGQVESQEDIGLKSNLRVVGLALEPDGGVVAVTGRNSDSGATSGPALLRLRPDGTRDLDFPTQLPLWPRGTARLSDGRMVVAGELPTELWISGAPLKTDLHVVALLPDGSVDPTFGGPETKGTAKLDACRFDRTSDVAVTPDDRIVVTFSCNDDGFTRVGVARFLSNGRLDTTFGSRGTWVGTTSVGSGAVATAPGGRILLAGLARAGVDNTDIVVTAIASGSVASAPPKAWGFGALGQLGAGSGPVVALAGGTHHTLAVTGAGTVQASGWNLTGQLGNGTTVDSGVPVTVAGLSGVVAVAAGTYHSLALRSDGTVWAWGWNHFGQLGNGTTVDSPKPVRVAGLTNIVSIAAGAHHNLALRSDGTAWAWGWNALGQLGNNSHVTNLTADSLRPVPVWDQGGVVAIAAGSYHSLFLYGDGEIRTAGWNQFGQLGHGLENGLAPSGVLGSGSLTGKYVAIAGGGLHSIAIRADGTVWSWGYNQLGELGNGTTTDSQTPVMATGVTNAAFVAGGGYHTVVLGRDGDLRAWGWNGYRQLGMAAPSVSVVPAPVTVIPAGTIVRGIAAGALHSLAF